MSSKNIRKSRK